MATNPLDELKYEKGQHLEALLQTCIKEKRAHAYFENEKDSLTDHLYFSGYGTWETRELNNQFLYGVMENKTTSKKYFCRIQSPLVFPHMMDRFWGMDVMDLGAYQQMMDRFTEETKEFAI